MQALYKQLLYEVELHKPQKISSIFIGGGTPSTVEAELYEDIFAFILPFCEPNCEITTEANPNSATLAWLEQMKNLGVNRLSFGVQSFHDEKLKFLGRAHSKKTAIQAVQNAFSAGIQNISLDLIYATKLDTFALLKEDVQTAMNLPINHLSAYALSIEENTKFYNHPTFANEDLHVTKDFFKLIESFGFSHYEISNFGKYESKHNLGYWEGKEYLGIGAGAVGFIKDKRFYPHKSVEDYIKNPLFKNVENLSVEDLHVEKIFLGLRSKIGLHVKTFNEREKHRVQMLVEEKKLIKNEQRYYNPDFLLADEIALFILD